VKTIRTVSTELKTKTLCLEDSGTVNLHITTEFGKKDIYIETFSAPWEASRSSFVGMVTRSATVSSDFKFRAALIKNGFPQKPCGDEVNSPWRIDGDGVLPFQPIRESAA
jgi:hypothetical protein